MQEATEMPDLDTPGDDGMEAASETWRRAGEALMGHLEDGEQVLAAAGVLERVALQFFDRCELVLTDRSVVILKPSWPWGYRFERSMPRSECTVSREKQRFDGSFLIVIRYGDEDLAFFVPRRSRDEGLGILEELR